MKFARLAKRFATIVAHPSGRLTGCISDFANALSKFLATLGTSDMPRTLGDILSKEEVLR